MCEKCYGTGFKQVARSFCDCGAAKNDNIIIMRNGRVAVLTVEEFRHILKNAKHEGPACFQPGMEGAELLALCGEETT